MHMHIKVPLYPKKNNLVSDAFYPTFIKWIRFLCYMMQHHLTCACQAVYSSSCVSFFFLFNPTLSLCLVTMNALLEEILGPLQYNIHGDEACQDKSYNDDLLQSMALDVDNMNLMLSNHDMFDDMMLDESFYSDTTTMNDTTLQQVLIDGLTTMLPVTSTLEESLQYIANDGGETETEAASLGYHSSPSLSSTDLMEPPSAVLPTSSQENDAWTSFFHHDDDTTTLEEQHMSSPNPTVSSLTTTSHSEMMIRNRGEEYTVIIMSGRVAQKSYGTEKR